MIVALIILEISVISILVIFLIREYRRQAVYRDTIRKNTEIMREIGRDWKI